MLEPTSVQVLVYDSSYRVTIFLLESTIMNLNVTLSNPKEVWSKYVERTLIYVCPVKYTAGSNSTVFPWTSFNTITSHFFYLKYSSLRKQVT